MIEHFDESVVEEEQPIVSTEEKQSGLSSGAIIGISVGAIVFCIFLLGVAIYYIKNSNKSKFQKLGVGATTYDTVESSIGNHGQVVHTVARTVLPSNTIRPHNLPKNAIAFYGQGGGS
jgi:hypothetical protein